MGFIKATTQYEFHGVQCAVCNKKETIKIKLGDFFDDPRFERENHKDEYVCNPCYKKKN